MKARPMDMPETLDAMIDAAAAALDLTLPEGSRPGIRRDVAMILDHARICADSLGDDIVEIAPTFRP